MVRKAVFPLHSSSSLRSSRLASPNSRWQGGRRVRKDMRRLPLPLRFRWRSSHQHIWQRRWRRWLSLCHFGGRGRPPAMPAPSAPSEQPPLSWPPLYVEAARVGGAAAQTGVSPETARMQGGAARHTGLAWRSRFVVRSASSPSPAMVIPGTLSSTKNGMIRRRVP